MSDNHYPMSFERIQAMRAAIDMVMRTTDPESSSYVAGIVTALAIEYDTNAAALANLAAQKMRLRSACEPVPNEKLRSLEA
jgi:hypothetical protein